MKQHTPPMPAEIFALASILDRSASSSSLRRHPSQSEEETNLLSCSNHCFGFHVSSVRVRKRRFIRIKRRTKSPIPVSLPGAVTKRRVTESVAGKSRIRQPARTCQCKLLQHRSVCTLLQMQVTPAHVSHSSTCKLLQHGSVLGLRPDQYQY